MVHIPVHDEDAAEAVRVEGMPDCQRHVVDEAEATELRLHGVVARGSEAQKKQPLRFLVMGGV